MNNSIYDYLEYYKDKTFNEVKFNTIDALIYSYIAYLPIDKIRDGTSLKTLNNLLSSIKINGGSMTKEAVKFVSIMANSIRYEKVKIYDVVKKNDDNIEFGAITFRDYSYTFVGFQGSIGTIAGWRENAYLLLNFPTLTQSEALAYLKRVVKLKDRNLYIGGHSKGGNLALASFYLAPRYVTNRVVKVFNFDGPGFRSEEFNSDRYKALKDRMLNILPDGSMIGIFLNHDKYNFIKSRNISIEKHFPINWFVFGEFLVSAEETKSSAALREKVRLSSTKLTYDEKKLCIDTFFELFENKKVKSFEDFTKLNIDDVKAIITNMKSIPKEKKKIILDAVKAILKNK